MSHFLYIHKDMTNEPNVWKVGVAMTPYSAVRARQKFCWNQFGLQYLYFGTAGHIGLLENKIKQHFLWQSGKSLQNLGTQTEMFKVDINVLLSYINTTITERELYVRPVELDKDYTASNSGSCPFQIPSEAAAGQWARNKCKEIFGVESIESQSMFNNLFTFE